MRSVIVMAFAAVVAKLLIGAVLRRRAASSADWLKMVDGDAKPSSRTGLLPWLQLRLASSRNTVTTFNGRFTIAAW